jgi:hypothetical protein
MDLLSKVVAGHPVLDETGIGRPGWLLGRGIDLQSRPCTSARARLGMRFIYALVDFDWLTL